LSLFCRAIAFIGLAILLKSDVSCARGNAAMETKSDPEIRAVSDTLTRHWRVFGLYPGAELTDEDGILWYRSPIHHIPYNAVIRTRIASGANARETIARICARFRELGLPFMWVVLPLDHPAGYETILIEEGLDKVEQVDGMSLNPAAWQPTRHADGVSIHNAEKDPYLSDYESLIRTYWSLPEKDRPTISVFNRYWSGKRSPGIRLVAYMDGRAVGKLFLNLSGLPDAGIFGVTVIEEARHRGIARTLTEEAIQRALERGATRIVLHSSPMARSLYDRLGFTERCAIPIYGTAPVYGTHHH
jgi:ribosomal protein S18 acetylase RimI-like enzyme